MFIYKKYFIKIKLKSIYRFTFKLVKIKLKSKYFIIYRLKYIFCPDKFCKA